MLGVSNEYGDLLIGYSQDNGESWSTPTVIARGSACTHEKGLHRAPMGVLHSHGRLWTGVDYGAWQCGSFANGIFSVPEGADLMEAENWSCSGFLRHSADWKNALPIPGGIENNVLEGPDGSIVSMLRYGEGRALLLRSDRKDRKRCRNFVRSFPFPWGIASLRSNAGQMVFIWQWETGAASEYSLSLRLQRSEAVGICAGYCQLRRVFKGDYSLSVSGLCL